MDKLNCTSGQGKPLSERHLLDVCAAVIWAGSARWAVWTRGLKAWFNPFSGGSGNSGFAFWRQPGKKDLLWGSLLAPKWQFRALLGFTPALLSKGDLAQDLVPWHYSPDTPLLWDPEPTELWLAVLPHLQNPLLNWKTGLNLWWNTSAL